MRLRLVVVMRATAFTSSGTPACGWPVRFSARACSFTDWLAETQPSVLMPGMTPAGHSVVVPRRVWISPFGSAKLVSISRSCGRGDGFRSAIVSLAVPFLSSVAASLSATTRWSWVDVASSSPLSPPWRAPRGAAKLKSS